MEGGRYDLPEPHGACYFGASVYAAWLEVFRSSAMVDLKDVRSRRLCTTHPEREVPTADLAAPLARQFEVTGEIHVIDDYTIPRQWSLALFRAGFQALHGKARHDPALQEETVTLLDINGVHKPYGENWRFAATRLDDITILSDLVSRYGIRVAPVPYDMPVDEPGNTLL